MKKALYLLALFLYTTTYGQQAFHVKEYLDINQIKAAMLVHGDLWQTGDTVEQHDCEFPVGSGKHLGIGGALWVGAYDNAQQLHMSAQTYSMSFSGGPTPVDAGRDYWPGPLDANGALNYTESQKWARIWKVNASDITLFKNLSTHTLVNTPVSVLEWPAKGNPYAKGANNVSLSIAGDMAPFVDVNNDGLYNPLNGDYPAIKGDQALWSVFSDNGPTHNATTGVPLELEIHAMVYGYHRGGVVDNMLFYEYALTNRSANDYDSCRIGIWADLDLGYAFDDYAGFDSTRRLGIFYNSKATDGTGAPDAYGTHIPVAGVTLLETPGDNCSIHNEAGSFVAYVNGGGVIGNPYTVPEQYNFYLRSKLFNGSAIPGGGRYMFPDDPSIANGNSECAKNIGGDDMRMVIASNDIHFSHGSTVKFAFALVATLPDTNNYCGSVNFNNIKTVTDSAWRVYCNPLSAGIDETVQQAQGVAVFPNPAQDMVQVKMTQPYARMVFALSDITGKALLKQPVVDGATVNISSLPPGVYLYRLSTDGGFVQAGKIVKE